MYAAVHNNSVGIYMRKVLIILTVFATVFFGLYQKQKVLILAYELDTYKSVLEDLEEEKADLLCSFLYQTNLASINERFRADGIDPQYPRQYVSIVRAFQPEQRQRPAIIARVLAAVNGAEAIQ